MSVPSVSLDVERLRGMHERAEQRRDEAAQAERAAYLRWEEAYGAYELARDEASAAWAVWVEAIAP
jgi:hypothetical protein